MELRQLRYFEAVAEEGGFVRAADRLGITQPALSRQLQALEDELGARLLERQPRGTRLTSAGEILLRHVRYVLPRLEQARAELSGLAQGGVGRIRLGFNEIAMFNPVVQRAVLAHRGRYPGVELDLMRMPSPDQLRAFEHGELDVGLMFGVPEENPDLLFREIAVYNMVAAMPSGHRLGRKRSLWLADFEDEPFVWIARKKYDWVHRQLMEACVKAGLAPRIVQESAGQEDMLSLIAQGLGVGFVHSSVQALGRVGLKFKAVADLDAPQLLYLVCRRDNASQSVTRFCDLLRQEPERPTSREH